MAFRSFIPIAAFLLSALFSSCLFAQETTAEVVPEEQLKSVKTDTDGDGWHFRVKPSSSFSFNDSRKVVGQPEGYSLTFGLNFESSIILFKGRHEWRNTFILVEAISRTPVIKEFIVTADSLDIESMYLYYFYHWFGLYGRLALNTHILPGLDVRPEQSTYAVTRSGGNIDTLLDDKVRLTDPFQPLTLKEGLGPFFRPLTKEEVNLEFMLGLSFWETFNEGQLAVKDDGGTSEIELITMQNVYQLGAESINRLWGELWEKRISYLAAAELMIPYYMTPDDSGLSTGEKLNVKINGRIDFHLVEWFALSYELKALREPQVLDDWQIQNSILMTLSYSLYKFKAY